MTKVKASRGAARYPKRQIAPYLFILPFLLSFLAFFLVPVVYSMVISLMKYKGYGTMKYVGFDNYRRLFTYNAMWNSLLNTLEYFVLARSHAMARWQKVYKPLLFLPQVCAVVASSLVFKVIFGTNVGAINQILGTSINFLGDTKLMKLPVICMLIWRNTGWYFIIFLSGLTTISDDLLDAAKIDGATSVQTMFYVTIPVMKPIFKLTFITYAIGAFKLYTEPNLILSKEEAPLAVAPFVNMITTNINGGALGMASAAGWILVLLILALTLMQMRMFKEGE